MHDKGDGLPVANSKRHGIPHQNNTGHRYSTELPITINEIVHTQGNAADVGEGQHGHRDDQTKPVDFVGSANAPEKEVARD